MKNRLIRYILNLFLLFLASLEQDIKKEEKKLGPPSKTDETKKPFVEIRTRASIREIPETGTPSKGFYHKVKSVAKNAIANTVYYPRSHYQNWKTTRYLKKNPNTDKTLNIITPGLVQNIGAAAPLGKQLYKKGELVYHAHAGHGIFKIRKPKERKNNIYKRLDKLRRKTGMSDEQFKKLEKHYIGHSSGGDLGQYIASDKKAKDKYGIDRVYSVAATGGGMELTTRAQKIISWLVPGVKEEDPSKSKAARKNIIKTYNRRPYIPVYNIYGKNDDLVPFADKKSKKKFIPYPHSSIDAVIADRYSDHFDTSFQNKRINEGLIDLKEKMYQHGKKYKKDKKKVLVYYSAAA